MIFVSFTSEKILILIFNRSILKKKLPLNIQLNIYRIVQELLANAVKHSGANNILLQCSQSEDHFFITIDNGKGFEKNSEEKTKSLGLRNLKQS
jgi:signal transduction histidine kinase